MGRVGKRVGKRVGDSEIQVFSVIYVAKIKFVAGKREGGSIR